MRIITKFMLALVVGGSLSLTACKDYDEDNYNSAINQVTTIDEALKVQIAALQDSISKLKKQKMDVTDITAAVEQAIKNASTSSTSEITVAINSIVNQYITNNQITQRITNLETELRSLNDVEGANLKAKIQALISSNKDVQAVPALQTRLDKIYTDSIKPMWEQVQINKDSIRILTLLYEANQTQTTTNKDSIAILKGLYEGIDLTQFYTKDEINEMNKQFTTLTKLNDTLAACKTEWENYANTRMALVNSRVDSLAKATKDSVTNLNYKLSQLSTDLTAADAKMKKSIDSLAEVTTAINARVDSVIGIVKGLEDAFAKQVTGIIVQQVYNPAFGSYNSLISNIQTNMLVAYYGSATHGTSFPSANDDNVDKYEIKSGQTLIQGIGNAGVVYVTINPNDVDFTGFKGLQLVNSQDQESGVVLGPVMESDEVLSLGYTRAAANGFYAVPATIPESAINNSNLHLNIDKSAIKNALKELIAIRNTAGAKVALKDLASVALQTSQAMKLDAQGVKCSWKDAYGVHSVNSNYNMAALAVKPLGFNSVDDIFATGGAYWRAYDKAKGLVTTAAKKIGHTIADQMNNQMGLGGIKADIADLQAKIQNAHMNPINPNTGEIKITTDVTVPQQNVNIDLDIPISIDMKKDLVVPGMTMKLDTTIVIDVPTGIDEVTGELVMGKTEIKIVKDFVVKEQNITVDFKYNDNIHVSKTVPVGPFTTTVNIDITKEVNDIFNGMLGDINGSFDSVNSLIDALDKAMGDVNVMLDGIDKLTEKLESGSYLNGIFKYLDKVAAKVGEVTPLLFKPTLLVNSDKGFGLAGFEGAPSSVSGTVTLVPTTYSAELLAPVFKKYIRVNNNAGVILEGNTIDVTSQLKAGVNTIEYYALDYMGNEWHSTYQIVRE